MNRRLLILLGPPILALAGWSVWWLGAAAGLRDAAGQWLAERRAAGWVAEAAGFHVAGYPGRLDAFVTGLSLADPAAGWAWEGEEVQILRLAYRPRHMVLAWPGRHRIAVPGRSATLSADRLEGSARFADLGRFAPEDLRIVAEGLALDLPGAGRLVAARAVAALRPSAPGTSPGIGYDLGLATETLALPPALLGPAAPAGSIAALRLDATLALDRPLDRRTVEEGRPNLAGLAVRELVIDWGTLRLEARGRMTVNALGEPEGSLDVVLRNWRAALRAAVAAGLLEAEAAEGLETGLALLAGLTGGGDTIRAPLTLAGGWLSLGPVPIAPLPRLAPPQRQ